MATYRELSQKICDGHFNEPFYYQPFYYVVFLPAINFVFGKGISSFLLIQSLISALTVLFIVLSAAMLKAKRAGVIAGTLAMLSSCLCLYVPYCLIETLQALWISVIIYLLILCMRRNKLYLWAICGTVVSLSILTRGNIWFFVPIFLVVALFNGGKLGATRRFVFPGIFLLMVILPQLPFSYWNWQKTGKFSGPSTAASAVLALGNTPEAPPGGRNPGTGPGPMEYPETYTDWVSQDEKISVSKKIQEWAMAEPLAFLELQFRKVLLFWDYREIPNNIAFEYQGVKSVILSRICVVPSSILICAFIAFVVSSLLICALEKRRKFLALLKSPIAVCAYCVIAFCLATASFYNLARFRTSSLPLFAIFAGVFIDDLIRVFTFSLEKKRWQMKLIFLGLLVAIFIVFFSYDLYRICESVIMRFVRPHGTRVLLSDARLLSFDNGPFTFGAWDILELKEGSKLEKHFDLSGYDASGIAKFAIKIFCDVPGEIILDVNGVEEKLLMPERGLNEYIINLGMLSEPKIIIKTKRLDAKVFFVLDTQRNYGRTLIDTKIAKGELVSRLYMKF
jgi:4-amino-4-deoxy-L-arabinose transferase-like glycosyltransferase